MLVIWNWWKMNIVYKKIEPTDMNGSGLSFYLMGMSLIYETEITLSLTNLAYPNHNQNNLYIKY